MNFGEEVAVNLTDATDEEKARIAADLARQESPDLTESTRDVESTGAVRPISSFSEEYH